MIVSGSPHSSIVVSCDQLSIQEKSQDPSSIVQIVDDEQQVQGASQIISQDELSIISSSQSRDSEYRSKRSLSSLSKEYYTQMPRRSKRTRLTRKLFVSNETLHKPKKQSNTQSDSESIEILPTPPAAPIQYIEISDSFPEYTVDHASVSCTEQLVPPAHPYVPHGNVSVVTPPSSSPLQPMAALLSHSVVAHNTPSLPISGSSTSIDAADALEFVLPFTHKLSGVKLYVPDAANFRRLCDFFDCAFTTAELQGMRARYIQTPIAVYRGMPCPALPSHYLCVDLSREVITVRHFKKLLYRASV